MVDRAAQYRESVLRTYRYLRVGMIALVLLLGAAVTIESIRSGELQDSISAYYYTPAHAVFVAALCAVGACLVIYRGHTDPEDVILNGSGFFAFVVAFVPTTQDTPECDPGQSFCTVPDSTIVANVLALLIVGGLGLIFSYFSLRPASAPGGGGSGRRAYAVVAVAYLVLLAAFIGWRSVFLEYGHYGAAILLLAGMVFVVVLNGLELNRRNTQTGGAHTALRRWYWGSFVFILVAAAFFGAAGAWIEHWLFLLETSVIVGFAVFWLTQTFGDVWNEPVHAPPAG